MSMKNWINKSALTQEQLEEKEALEQWKEHLEINIKNMQQELEKKGSLPEMQGYQDVDTKTAWRRFMLETNIEEETTIRSINPIWKYAAAACFLLVGAWFVMNNGSGNDLGQTQKYAVKSEKEIILEDQSIVRLSADAVLETTNARTTKLSGKAFFKVSKDASQPFTIQTSNGLVTVLGTQFEVVSMPEYTQVYVSEGKVKYNHNGKDYILTAGEMARTIAGETMELENIQMQVQVQKSAKIEFKNERLINVLHSMATRYDVMLEYSKDLVDQDKCKINTSYTKETLEQVLQELEMIGGLKYEMKGKRLIIKSIKC
jgi:transmembrane sensor